MKNAIIGLRIDKRLKENLQVQADMESRTLSNLIDVILQEWMLKNSIKR